MSKDATEEGCASKGVTKKDRASKYTSMEDDTRNENTDTKDTMISATVEEGGTSKDASTKDNTRKYVTIARKRTAASTKQLPRKMVHIRLLS